MPMACINYPDVQCPGSRCPGRASIEACRHARRFQDIARPKLSRFRREPRRINVGFICPCLVMGGAEAVQVMTAQALDRGVFNVVGVAVTYGEHSIHPDMADAYVGMCPVVPGRDAAARLAKECDVLVTWAIDDLPALLPRRGRKPKVVGVVHAPKESKWGQTVYSKPEGIDLWVPVSGLATEAIPEASRASVPVRPIMNAVDESRLVPTRSRFDVRTALGIDPVARVALFVQRFSWEKDADAGVRLAGSLPPGWVVVMVGDGEDMGAIRRAKDAAGLGNLVLVGADRRVGDYLNASDVVVIPSEHESFCLTMAEALVFGRPVVATPVGLESIRPGLVHRIPFHATGTILARACIHAVGAGPVPGATRWATDHLGSARFGAEWRSVILGLARSSAPVDDASIRLAMKAETCPHASGPCGCGSGPPRECSRPDKPDKVRRADCLACVSAEDWTAKLPPG